MLKSLLPIHAVVLTASEGIDRATVVTDDIEVMPALPLGDVIVEELGVDVPMGALIVLTDADMLESPVNDEDLSYDMGFVVGEVLLTVIRLGAFPLERETAALYTMAAAYDRLAEASGLQHLGLHPRSFRAGLVCALGTYWSGARSSCAEVSGLFLRSDCLAGIELRAYLKSLDASFDAPAHARIPASLMAFSGGTRPLEDWLGRTRRAVLAQLDQTRTKATRLGERRTTED
ncbi:hypothetical protein [Maritimibacter alkaliphilus]|uniref:hypothetical protein n=1 Tax=Maritimibacter alkaliphilus TaxID=404236 RepID=UPI001C966F46|nr:hypothetical protein [Maritimibacter alkaliphilus]MBY6093052.1 hypothetical protein [Maritimibacter alkaliphilus]